ncbi:ROK family transcriptional regulator [Cellulomonas bogoriensis]|uniref:ROK family transcriptional regulator n=1 Tax=Cellulomonas bogoriensis 69B4 = DSM 16987 TaxID=1386082 RepID=A0A0A0BR03_9CELL|nr:ROK family transcriptional regulator [Cellulomonas bogoriensis]KGM10898.1 ROK family transcriptional regulator [Cellulomonas bogoriensis 69B4 = DSM 16987]
MDVPGSTQVGPEPRLSGRGAATRAARQQSLRHHNLGLTLRHIIDAPTPVSRADVAAATGLTRATVSALVDRLLAAGLVAELEPVVGHRAGRPAVPLVPARGTVAAVGMEVNVDYLGVRALDLAGRVISERIELGDFRGSEPGEVLDRLARLAGAVLALLSADGVALVGSALALPGLVDTVTGPLRVAPNLGWREVDVVGLLAAHPVLAGMPPRLMNEANLAARAEAHARRVSGPTSFVYVSGEVGVGGAIVLDGTIFGGRHGWSGEIGHLVLGTSGAFEDGGTLESFAGQDAILARAGLARSTSVQDLLAAAAGDEAVRGVLADAGRALGTALANVVNIVDVHHVVLGGIYAQLAEHLREPVVEQLRRRVITAQWSTVELSVAVAGQFPAMTGGALAVLETLVDDPAGWAGEDVLHPA